MDINAIKNKPVKLSARSITCKDENGKTCGIVTQAISFKSLPANRQTNYWKLLCASGLWKAGESDKVYIIGDSLYYLYDLRPIEFYEKYLADLSGYDNDKQKYLDRKYLAAKAGEIATVIPCYILN